MTQSNWYDDLPAETLAEIEGERIAAAQVRALLREAAEIAVQYRMDIWGDGNCGALIADLRKAVWVARGCPEAPPAQSKPKTRSPIAATKRVRIFARDGYRCVLCGADDPESLSLDHIVAWSRGGSDDDENLRTLCRTCNGSKGTKDA